MTEILIDQIFEDIVETIREPLLVLDSDLKVVLANRSFYDSFKVKPEENVGQLIYDLGNKQWDIPKLRELLETILPEKTAFDNYEVEHDFATIGRRVMLLNARQIKQAMGKERIILLAIEDITERKKLEDLLAESEDRFRRLFETADDGILLLEKSELKIRQSNPAIKAMLGYSNEECIGKDMNDIGFPDDIGAFQEVMQTLNKDGIIHYNDVSVRDKVGQYIDTDIYMVNRASIVQCNIRDITDRKKAGEALRESEDRYRTFFEKGSDGVVILNPETAQIIEFNDQACRQLGFSREEFARLRVSDVEVKETAKETQERIGSVLEKGYRDFDTLQRTKQGEIRHVHVTAQLIETTGRNVYHCIWRDITERKRSEEALRESEGKYRTIFENIQDVYYETSLDGTILEISPSIESASQYSRNELVGKSLYDIYTNPEDRDELLKLFLDKGTVSDFEVALTDKDGSQRPCSISALLIRDEQDNPIKLVGTIRDIAERKRAESERKRLEVQLLQAHKMESIGNLAGGIAHDFNNILSSVIGFTELSLDEVEKGTHLEDNLQEVYTAGKRARDLVRQILAFARQSEAELKPIYVDTIATEVLKFIRASIPTTIEIKQNIESDSLIMGNATQVHQILMNLFTNAAHAMEDNGGILEFSLKDVVMDCDVTQKKLGLKQGKYIEIEVSDTGTGIAPEIIDSIFDPYFTTKGPGEGTGMGLATVHGIIESYGGKISVDSKPGQGTLFTIYLPVSRKHQEHASYQSETLPAGTERILFVDDEAPIAKMEGQTLESLGYTVSIRTSSMEALELFRTKPNDFDLVITDMTMPNMTGDRLAIELMRIRPDIPVILCTGYSKKISEESASEMGIKAFIRKPVVNADLSKTIRKVLDEAKSGAHA